MSQKIVSKSLPYDANIGDFTLQKDNPLTIVVVPDVESCTLVNGGYEENNVPI